MKKPAIGRWIRSLSAHISRLNAKSRAFLMRADIERILSFGYKSPYPQRQLLVGYAAYSLIGALLLLLPFASRGGIGFVDHLFTSVSALSTTGLSTVDVANQYTFFGQLVILLLIQLGGVGYMTLSSYVMFRLSNHLGSAKAKVFNSQFSFPDSMNSSSLVRNIVNFTFLLELIGIIALYPRFLTSGVEQPLWSAVFHSISSFCTAGFSIYSDNLIQFQTDYYVNIVIIVLSYMGAMGFIVMTDLWRKLVRRGYRITFTTKVIVVVTFILSFWGTLHLFFFEPSLQGFSTGDRFVVSLFQSMSAMTTVGYNTVDIGLMAPISLLILSVVMYVGASPSGTGGGLKSTTLSAIFAYTKTKLGMRRDVSLMGNRIPSYRIETAITTFTFYTFILLVGIYLISLFEPVDADFLKIVFEASSALATAGLSSGILSHITVYSKVVLILLMFIGRLGVLTLGNVMLVRSHMRSAAGSDDLAV